MRADIAHEFLALPGLKLTFYQACRLWDLDEDNCARLLAALVADGLLEIGPDGGFRRAVASTRRTA